MTWPLALAAVIGCAPGAECGQTSSGIRVLSGQFGTLGAKVKLDVVQPLQLLCGPTSTSCSTFCSETSFGRFRLGRKPICRVTYRCPDDTVRAVEAAKEELILLRCEDDAAETGEAAAAPAPADQPQPPPYVPPQGR